MSLSEYIADSLQMLRGTSMYILNRDVGLQLTPPSINLLLRIILAERGTPLGVFFEKYIPSFSLFVYFCANGREVF